MSPANTQGCGLILHQSAYVSDLVGIAMKQVCQKSLLP